MSEGRKTLYELTCQLVDDEDRPREFVPEKRDNFGTLCPASRERKVYKTIRECSWGVSPEDAKENFEQKRKKLETQLVMDETSHSMWPHNNPDEFGAHLQIVNVKKANFPGE